MKTMNAWKNVLGIAGLLAAVLAVMTGRAVVFWAAVALLGTSLVVRLVDRVRTRRMAAREDSLSGRMDE